MDALERLREEIRRFVSRRNWEDYHSPKNLSMAIAIEASELMEHFQWIDAESTEHVETDGKRKEKIEREVADVLIYLLSFCNRTGIDPVRAVEEKLEINRNRFPADTTDPTMPEEHHE